LFDGFTQIYKIKDGKVSEAWTT